jgi:tetratricopeptide (TPR) repeat protein
MNDPQTPGEMEAAAAHYAAAEQRFKRALEQETDTGRLFALLRGYALTDDSISVPILLRVLDLDPENLRALTALAQLYVMMSEYVDAYAYYRTAAALAPLAPDDLSVLELSATLATNWEERFAAYRRILELYPDDPKAVHDWGNLKQAEKSAKEHPDLLGPRWPPGQHRPE